jgi:hypothetical protein
MSAANAVELIKAAAAARMKGATLTIARSFLDGARARRRTVLSRGENSQQMFKRVLTLTLNHDD